jgi:hypothetical protein
VEAQEKPEIASALEELAAAFGGLVEVLLDGGQVQLTHTGLWRWPPG